MVSCCWSLCYCWRCWCTNGVVGVSAIPFKHAVAGCHTVDGVLAVGSVPDDPGVSIIAGGFRCWIAEWDVLHYQTIAIGLWFFFQSNYRNIKYRIGEFKKLSDCPISDQNLDLFDYRISDSEKTIGCPPLAILHFTVRHFYAINITQSSVPDPDLNPDPDPPDPRVFGPSGSGSISQRYGSRSRSCSGSGSGSFYH